MKSVSPAAAAEEGLSISTSIGNTSWIDDIPRAVSVIEEFTNITLQNAQLAALRRLSQDHSNATPPSSLLCEIVVPSLFKVIASTYVNSVELSPSDIPDADFAENASHLVGLLINFINRVDSSSASTGNLILTLE